MAKRSLSLPGRPSGFSLMERRNMRRKRVHWSSDLEEVIYFAPDTAVRRYDLSTMRCFDRRVRILRSRTSSVNKRLPLKASQTFARSIHDVNSTLLRTGVDIFSQQLDRFRSKSENLKLFDDHVNNSWKELLALYQKRMRDQLDSQEEEWVWFETPSGSLFRALIVESVVFVHAWFGSQRRVIVMIPAPYGRVKVPQWRWTALMNTFWYVGKGSPQRKTLKNLNLKIAKEVQKMNLYNRAGSNSNIEL